MLVAIEARSLLRALLFFLSTLAADLNSRGGRSEKRGVTWILFPPHSSLPCSLSLDDSRAMDDRRWRHD